MGKFITLDEKQIERLSVDGYMNHIWWFSIQVYTDCAVEDHGRGLTLFSRFKSIFKILLPLFSSKSLGSDALQDLCEPFQPTGNKL